MYKCIFYSISNYNSFKVGFCVSEPIRMSIVRVIRIPAGV